MTTPQSETATFAAGCFWGIEAAFAKTAGVLETAVGYMGDTTQAPTYQQVCTGTTGHAEVAQVRFDPVQVSYAELLSLFWTIHDPTQLNRQGPDVGTQYRSAIFYHNDSQREAAELSKATLNASGRTPGKRPVATTIESAQTFWRAEDYHQRYFERHPLRCH